MQKRTREILGLALLLILGIGVAFGMGWYILVGHNWNVAASNIDDSIGQMDGYTIVLFEGTHKQQPAKPAGSENASRPAASESSVASRSSAAAKESTIPSAGEPQSPSTAEASNSSAGESARSSADSSSSAQAIEPDEDRPTLDEVRKSYWEKGAAVFFVKPNKPAEYAEPFVVERKGKRIGVCSVLEPARVAQARVDVKLLERQKAGLNVLMTDDASLAGSSIRGLDIIISNSSQGVPGKGRSVGSTYCVETPYEGEVQAVIISPSGVISTKTIESL